MSLFASRATCIVGNKLHYHNAIRRAPIGRFPFGLAGANARISWSLSRTASIGQSRTDLNLSSRFDFLRITLSVHCDTLPCTYEWPL